MMASALLGLLLWNASVAAMPADAGAPSQGVTFHLEPAVSQILSYTIEINHDGTGRYWVGPLRESGELKTPIVPLTVTAPTMAKILGAEPTVQSSTCETHTKNIANTGRKTMTYVDDGKVSECAFNYSDDPKLNDAVSTFQAIAQTIQTGDKLKHDHRFDHLGLDADLDSLAASAKAGYAVELQNIAPILQSLVNDEEMMSPVRRKATALLQMGGVQAAPSAR